MNVYTYIITHIFMQNHVIHIHTTISTSNHPLYRCTMYMENLLRKLECGALKYSYSCGCVFYFLVLKLFKNVFIF